MATQPSPTASAERPRKDATPFLIAACIFLVLAEIGGYFASKSVARSPDFRSFYAAGYMVRTQPSQLYDVARQKQVQDTLVAPTAIPLPFFHPSYEALLYAPFSLLKFRAAYLSFMFFNVIFLMSAFFAGRSVFSEIIPILQPRPGLMFFFFAPLVLAVIQGQDSVLFLLLCCLTWRQLERRNDLSAGCFLALALFRFQLAIPLAIFIAIRRGWRFCAGFLAGAIIVVLASFVLVGRAGVAALLHLLSAGSLSGNQDALAQSSMAIYPLAMPNLFGLLYASGTRHLSPHVAFLVVAVASAALFLWCVYLVRRAPDMRMAFGIAILCSVLVSYHLYLHDATLLLLPLALLAPRTRFGIGVICYWLPAILILVFGSDWYFLLAVPILALLIDAATGKEGISIDPSTTSAPTPLYTW